jgi:hypothetical protein
MSIEDVELTLERALREALATRRALAARIVEAEEEVRALRRRAAEVEAIIEHTQMALGGVGLRDRGREPLPEASPSVVGASSKPAAARRRFEKPLLRPDTAPVSLRFNDLTATQAATIVLREAGGPLHVNAIFNKLLENGFEFHGDNPTISLAVALARSKRFRKVAPATFDLIIRDVPMARVSESG